MTVSAKGLGSLFTKYVQEHIKGKRNKHEIEKKHQKYKKIKAYCSKATSKMAAVVYSRALAPCGHGHQGLAW